MRGRADEDYELERGVESLRRMNRSRISLLALACISCGGRTAVAADAGASSDADAVPEEAALGDGGLVCSTPSVTLTHDGHCNYVVTCTGGTAPLVIDGRCLGSSLTVRCSVNGIPTKTLSTIAACDCANPAGFPSLSMLCLQ